MNDSAFNSGFVTHALRGAGRVAQIFIQSKLTPLAIGAALLLGAFAILQTPREEEPQIVVPMLDVFVQMPGASAEEVAQRATVPMEKLLREVPDVVAKGDRARVRVAVAALNPKDALFRKGRFRPLSGRRFPPRQYQTSISPTSNVTARCRSSIRAAVLFSASFATSSRSTAASHARKAMSRCWRSWTRSFGPAGVGRFSSLTIILSVIKRTFGISCLTLSSGREKIEIRFLT